MAPAESPATGVKTWAAPSLPFTSTSSCFGLFPHWHASSELVLQINTFPPGSGIKRLGTKLALQTNEAPVNSATLLTHGMCNKMHRPPKPDKSALTGLRLGRVTPPPPRPTPRASSLLVGDAALTQCGLQDMEANDASIHEPYPHRHACFMLWSVIACAPRFCPKEIL